jgi:hypothetical protein
MVKVKNQPDVKKYAVLLPQHVSGTNILSSVMVHCNITLGLTILRIFSRYDRIKRNSFINCTPDDGHIGAQNILRQQNRILCRI